jgi:hypothetical protein
MSPANTYDPSPAALRPLMETFWSPQGWNDRPAWPPPEVMERAVKTGVMFAEPRSLDHDGWVHAARTAVRACTTAEVGEAFLASLTGRRLDLRSALGSYAAARFLPDHSITVPPNRHHCAVCGLHESTASDPEDLNVLNFERFQMGHRPGIPRLLVDRRRRRQQCSPYRVPATAKRRAMRADRPPALSG